ncbi:hypothetical protein HJA87_15845 [Rhizobium bangladeshense]|uniref:DUF1146 domain-containing protein n=1 Tax=Rhizobium bangladeshense TaxID=1138189 RepID=A0ABS7LIW3_9HYPH|nr:hypothetical protein [Rhizobium bangladeshense]MBY3591330.1 hypothetical protein [Rhizobium bangladeshense]
MDSVPIVLVTFKVLALAIAMFFAIKWHYDQGEKAVPLAILRTGVTMTAGFLLAVLIVTLIAFTLSGYLGLDLRFPR